MEKAEVFALLEKHYRENSKALHGRVYRYVKSQHRAEDVVQEAYCRAFQYWNTLRSEIELNGWFSGILNNCVKDNHKEENMHGMLNYSEIQEQAVKPTAIPRILQDEVVARINKEPEHTATILRMALIDQYRPKEISQVVKESPGAIRQIVYRFREVIRKEFKWTI